MRISVIIPVHNASDSIRRSADSFLKQNYRDLELILIDDHSEDGSFEILQELSDLYEGIVITAQSENRGVSAARNKGLSLATGEIIAFCDADDFTADHSLQYVEAFFRKYTEIDLLISGFNRVAGEKIIRTIHIGCNKKKVWTAGRALRHSLYDKRVMGAVWNKFFRKRLIGTMVFDERLSYTEDTYFLVKLLSHRRTARVCVCPEPLYNYSFNPSSATNSAGGLFGKKGRLKYDIAMECILRLCTLSNAERMIVRHGRFSLAADVFAGMDISPSQKAELLKIMKQNLGYYLAVMPWNFKADVRRLLNLLRKTEITWGRDGHTF